MRCFNALRRTHITDLDARADNRLAALKAWVRTIDTVAGCELALASDDASFRRYFRLSNGADSFVVMDAPPEQEDCLPFVRVAGYLEAMRLNGPRILEANLDEGFLLLSDFGTHQYLDALRQNPDTAATLYGDAIAALAVLQRRGVAYQSSLPPYDETLLRFELSLFDEWLCGTHLGISFSGAEKRDWQRCCDALVDNALNQPQVFVHRDYHSRNLMITEEHNPGILDFQDAVEGPLTYDLVSLLKDCYVRWPRDEVRHWARSFYQQLDAPVREQVSEDQFWSYFDLMGVQRHLKAAGIFARLSHRDGKPGYLTEIPRALSYIVELEAEHGELKFLAKLIRTKVLPALGDPA